MSEIEWVDELPERRSPPHEPKYGYAILDALRANPGKWAKLWTYEVTGSASSARASLIKKGYEAECRGGDLYARWPTQDDHGEAPEPTPSGLKHHVARQHPESA